MAHRICYTTATHSDATGPFCDFAAAQADMRREARYFRARNGYIVEVDDASDAEFAVGLEFACDYSSEILDAAES